LAGRRSRPRHVVNAGQRRGPRERGERGIERGAEDERRDRERARPEPPDDGEGADRLELEEEERGAGTELGEGPSEQRIPFGETGAQAGEGGDAVDHLEQDVCQHEREYGALTARYHGGTPPRPRRLARGAPDGGTCVAQCRMRRQARMPCGSPCALRGRDVTRAR